MLAVVSYRKLISSSHTAEATHMVQAIRVAQEAYHAETQQYANVSTDINSTYPAPGSGGQPVPGRFKTGWGAACTNCNSGIQWTDLPKQGVSWGIKDTSWEQALVFLRPPGCEVVKTGDKAYSVRPKKTESNQPTTAQRP